MKNINHIPEFKSSPKINMAKIFPTFKKLVRKIILSTQTCFRDDESVPGKANRSS